MLNFNMRLFKQLLQTLQYYFFLTCELYLLLFIFEYFCFKNYVQNNYTTLLHQIGSQNERDELKKVNY